MRATNISIFKHPHDRALPRRSEEAKDMVDPPHSQAHFHRGFSLLLGALSMTVRRPNFCPIIVLILSCVLAGCQSTGSAGTDSCGIWRAITWSSKDTPQTVDEVKGNNARRQAFCKK